MRTKTNFLMQLEEIEQSLAHRFGGVCENSSCQKCCPHDERDYGMCLDCGHEEDPGEAIDRAMDTLEDR